MTGSGYSDTRTYLRRLATEAAEATKESRDRLNAAVLTAWKIGQLLRTEQRRVRRKMGRDAWSNWLMENFSGSQQSAARFMRLARSISNINELEDLSLRQIYFRLGIPTEPKRPNRERGIPCLPPYVHNAQRLLVSVRMRLRMRQMHADDRRRLCQDLSPLYQQLNALFADTFTERRQ